jgi:hypothetical protein
MYTIENMDMTWFTESEIYKVTKNITAAVYAFAWVDKKPTDTTFPFQLESLFYVGMTGGLSADHTADKKGPGREPSITTALHQRMKLHLSRFNRPGGNFGKEQKKYDLYHSLHSEEFKKGKVLCIGLLTPKPHIPKHGKRNMLSLIESEQEYLYQKTYGNLPALNLAESDGISDTRKKEYSHSQQKIKSITDGDLTQFMVG